MYTLVAVLALAVGNAFAGLSSSSNNIAVYWGQNSHGLASGDFAQQRLSFYCANSDIDVIPMAFTIVIDDSENEPEINFANAGNNCTTFPGTSLLDCPQLAEDIPICQNTFGKTILLSIGGATYTEGGFSTAAKAVSAAQTMWATFGPPISGSTALRPFGSASVDGFDFDFEALVSNMVPFANELRSLMDADTASSGKEYFLTAAPQCPFPDLADNSMLNGTVFFDAIWAQFYNNFCGLQSFQQGAAVQNNFNFETWDNWAKTISANPLVKVLLGVPASPTAAGSGYEPVSGLQPIIDYCKQFSSFGGVMMWDASQAEANTGFLSGVADALTTASKRVMRRGSRLN